MMMLQLWQNLRNDRAVDANEMWMAYSKWLLVFENNTISIQ